MKNGAIRGAIPLLLVGTLLSCRSGSELVIRRALDAQGARFGQEKVDASPAEFSGDLQSYTAYAMKTAPVLRAAFERWRAAVSSVARHRKLPEPTLSYTYYVQSVETRVGPQRHRIGLSQSFPWPTKLISGGRAASARARAMQSQFDAVALALRKRVATAYWQLWRLREVHALKSEHDVLMETLAGTVRGRVQTGAASLADLNQVELNIARHHDHHGAHREAFAAAEARLAAALGISPARAGIIFATTDAPVEGLPVEAASGLMDSARENPAVRKHAELATAQEEHATAVAADKWPRFKLGVTVIETGEAQDPALADSGKDPVMVSLGLGLPLWWRSYDDAERAERARAAAHRGDHEEAELVAMSGTTAALSSVRDAQRRIMLYRNTLIPQAETTFRSVLGGYQTGRSTVAAVLLAQADLLTLRLELIEARAEHQISVARLAEVVGRDVELESGEPRR